MIIYTTSTNYKVAIKEPSRSFECRVTIGDNVYKNEDIVDIILEYPQPQDGFAIGNTPSQSLDLTLINKGDTIYSTSQIKVEIGLKIGSKIEYIPMGIFNIDDIEKIDYKTKFTCYDNMIKFETAYFSSLGDKPTLQQVVNELVTKTGVQFTGSLPAYTVKKLEGFTCREVLSYVASICGGNAFITREGKFTIKSLLEVDKSIDGNNYFEYKREEVKYKIGKVSCQVDEQNILSKGSLGTDSMELQFENPWVDPTILTDIYNKLNGLSYLGYSMKWQGDLSLDPYDIIAVTDTKNVIRKIPILGQKITYTGGLTSEIEAKGESKNKNSFSSSGSTSNKVNRLVTEQAVIKEALIEKANISDLKATNAEIEKLKVKDAEIENVIINKANIEDLTAINVDIQNLIAADAQINQALIGKADITDLNAVKGNINSLTSQIADIETLVNGNLSSENIQAGGITSDKLTIEDGFITNAMIANLDVSKINAGDISTNKFRIVSDNGGIEIVGATQQFKDKNNKVRIQMGQDTQGNFNFILRGEDGTTTLIDHTGIKENAIADDLIKENMVAADAIGEKQINYSSLITGLNKDTNTLLIKGSKVAIDLEGQTLDVAFNSLKTQADNTKSLTEIHSTTIGVMQGQINTAINNTQIVKDGQTVLLKDDYNRTVEKVDSINNTIGTHTTKINELTGSITSVDTKVNSIERDLEGTKSIVSSNSKQISGLDSKVTSNSSSITQLQKEISLKVEESKVNTIVNNAVGNINIGGRNLLLNSGFVEKTTYWNTYSVSSFTVEKDTNSKSGYVAKFVSTGGGIYQRNGGNAGESIPYEKGIKLIVSGYFKCSSVASLVVGLERTSTKSFTPKNANTWTYFEVSVVANGDSTTWIFYGTNGNTYHLKDVKVEKGNKATDWTPAPEDVEGDINNVNSKVETTNNKVASIETNLNSITQRVSSTESKITDINGNISSLQSRMSSAESKITSTAIINTVQSTINAAKNEAINSANSNTDKKLQGYATKTEVTTTAENVIYKFSASGGYNLLKNSAFANKNTENWVFWGGASRWSDTSYYKNIGDMYILNTNTNNPGGLWQLGIPIKPNTKYTLSVLCYKEVNVKDGWFVLEYQSSVDSSVITYQDVRLTFDDKRHSYTFTTPNNNNIKYAKCGFRHEGAKATGGGCLMKINKPCLAEGEVSVWSPNPFEIKDGSIILDGSGITIKNGALKVQNKAGQTVLSGDNNGNITLTGTVKSQTGAFYVALDSGGITFKVPENNEQLLRIATTYKVDDTTKNINGVSFAMPQYADYMSFSHINKPDLTNDWGSASQYRFMEFWSVDRTLGSTTYRKGINIFSPIYVENGIQLYSGSSYLSEILGAVSWNSGNGEMKNLLGLYGDNGVALGYKAGKDLKARLIVTEGNHPGTSDTIISWGNQNFNGYTLRNVHVDARSLTVSGTKNCLQNTKNYGERLINAYETAEYYFGDLGFGTINNDGECVISVDDIFLECINTDAEYHVFTQVYKGAIKCIERYKTYFIVKGEANTKFSWELKAKRIGYENNRLDTADLDCCQPESNEELFNDKDFTAVTSEKVLIDFLTFDLASILMEG